MAYNENYVFVRNKNPRDLADIFSNAMWDPAKLLESIIEDRVYSLLVISLTPEESTFHKYQLISSREMDDVVINESVRQECSFNLMKVFLTNNVDQLNTVCPNICESLAIAAKSSYPELRDKQITWWFNKDQQDICGLSAIVAPSKGGKTRLARHIADQMDGIYLSVGESIQYSAISSYDTIAKKLCAYDDMSVIDSLKDLSFLTGNLGKGGVPNELYLILHRLDDFYRTIGALVVVVLNPLTLGATEDELKPFVTAVSGNTHGIFVTETTANGTNVNYHAQGYVNRKSLSFNIAYDEQLLNDSSYEEFDDVTGRNISDSLINGFTGVRKDELAEVDDE